MLASDTLPLDMFDEIPGEQVGESILHTWTRKDWREDWFDLFLHLGSRVAARITCVAVPEDFELLEAPDKIAFRVLLADVATGFKNQGLGTEMYLLAAREAAKRNGVIRPSEKPSVEAQRVWNGARFNTQTERVGPFWRYKEKKDD